MSVPKDTPLNRFVAFWIVVGLAFLFIVFGLILTPMLSYGEAEAAETEGNERRLAIREEVDQSQSEQLAEYDPKIVFEAVGKDLLSRKPAAVVDEAQKVPVITEVAADADSETSADEEAEEEAPE